MAVEFQNSSVVDQVMKPSATPQWNFGFANFLKREYKFGLDSARPLCKAFLQGHCPQGDCCPDKHYQRSNYSKYVKMILSKQQIQILTLPLVSSASTGYVDYAKRVIAASFFTNTTFAACPNALTGFARVCAQMDRTVFTCTSIHSSRNLHVRTTKRVSVP